jgi:hypothetical protein
MACSPERTVDPTPLPCNEEVAWEQAIEILHTGQVESVVQLHSLEVSFMLENGCRITTVEPRIDDIFKEIDKCVNSCGVTSFATE